MAVDLKREAPSGNSAFSRRERKGGEEVRGMEVVEDPRRSDTYLHTNDIFGEMSCGGVDSP